MISNMPVYEDQRNPMRIPDLSPMYEAVRDFVKENQGDKGFICTEDNRCDTIWAYVYDDTLTSIHEFQIKAVRVKDNRLEVLYDISQIYYEDEMVRIQSEDEWYDVQCADLILYVPTIFNIAECIQEYV